MTIRRLLCPSLILGALLVLLAACAGSSNQPPPPTAGLGAPLAVSQAREEGFEGDIVFGPYRVGGILPERVKQADWRFVGRQGLVMHQAISFAFTGGSRDWHCLCAIGDNNAGMPLNIGTLWGHGFSLDNTQSKTLACILRPVGGGKTWRMSLYAPPTKWKDQGMLADPTAEGALSDGVATTIRIKAKGVVAVETVGAKMPAMYHFLGENGELSQVKVTPPRRVWLSSGPLREPLAAAAGALLAVHRGRP